MNKRLIPSLLIVPLCGFFVFAIGNHNGTRNDRTALVPSHIQAGAFTAQIMPPAAAGIPINLTTQLGMSPDSVNFSVSFSGSQSQSVSVSGGPAGSCILTPTKLSCTQCAPANGTNISVTATDVAGSAYSSVTSVPASSPNNSGSGTTIYSDANGNSVAISIRDVGVPCTGH